LIDDNVIVFAITMKIIATAIVYSTTCTKKHRSHRTNFIISIGILSLQCTHPWVFFAIIHKIFNDGSKHAKIRPKNSLQMLKKRICDK
jgi:hypothetical protein